MSTAIPPQGNDDPQTREFPRAYGDQPLAPGHREVVARQKDEFGGMKFGAGFFGWLAATGMAVLLTALAAGITAAVGAGSNVTPDSLTSGNLQAGGVVGAIILLVIILVAYFCGGYVAGRMARFNGVKQGVAVWLWALIVTIVLVVIGAIAGSQSNVMSRVPSLNSLGVDAGAASTAGIIGAVSVAVVALVGAILGGLAGMRFHRRVDKVGLS